MKYITGESGIDSADPKKVFTKMSQEKNKDIKIKYGVHGITVRCPE